VLLLADDAEGVVMWKVVAVAFEALRGPGIRCVVIAR
jgi:hypothetical protein